VNLAYTSYSDFVLAMRAQIERSHNHCQENESTQSILAQHGTKQAGQVITISNWGPKWAS